MTFPGRSSSTFPGRPLTLTVAAIVLALVMTVLSERSVTPEPALGGETSVASEEEPTPTASAAAPVATQDEDEPRLRVRVQMPSTLQAGGGRQFRISADSGQTRSRNDRRDPLVRVQLRVSQPASLAGSVVVTPDALILRRSELRQTRFELHVLSHVGCDVPVGSLQVRVTEITESGPTGEATLELPPVTCETPPEAPDSVHDTTPECGDGLELQEWLLDTEDPPADEVCQEPGAAPQPAPTPPAEQAPEPSDGSTDADEDGDPDDPAAEDDAEAEENGAAEEDAEAEQDTDDPAEEQPSTEDEGSPEDGAATDDAPEGDPPADDTGGSDGETQGQSASADDTQDAPEADVAEQRAEG